MILSHNAWMQKIYWLCVWALTMWIRKDCTCHIRLMFNFKYYHIRLMCVWTSWHWQTYSGNITISIRWGWTKRPNSEIPQCTCPISHNAPVRTNICTFLFWMVHCGIWNKCIWGFMRLVYCYEWNIFKHNHAKIKSWNIAKLLTRLTVHISDCVSEFHVNFMKSQIAGNSAVCSSV